MAAAVIALSGCSGSRPTADKATTAPAVAADGEHDRCRKLGLKVYEDNDCQRLQRRDRARFLGKTAGVAP